MGWQADLLGLLLSDIYGDDKVVTLEIILLRLYSDLRVSIVRGARTLLLNHQVLAANVQFLFRTQQGVNRQALGNQNRLECPRCC